MPQLHKHFKVSGKHKTMQGWINPIFLDYDAQIATWTIGEIYSWKRPFEHLKHAEGLLQIGDSEFVRNDIITTLKRAIDHRLKVLNKMYCWKKIPFSLPKDELQKLEVLGVIKKNMLLNLFKIRNEVEHHDQNIPSINKCLELTELTWYFLKSTNHLVVNSPSELWFTDETESEFTRVEFEPQNNWRINILTRENSKEFAFTAVEGWITVSVIGKEQMGKETHLRFAPDLTDSLGIKLLNIYFFQQS